MTLQNTRIIGIIAVVLGVVMVLSIVLVASIQQAHGSLLDDEPAISNQFRAFNLFASSTVESVIATSTNATSTNLTAYSDSQGRIIDGSADVRGAKHIDVYATRGGTFAAANTGTSTYSIQGTSGDGIWYYVNRLLTSTSSPTASPGLVNGVLQSDPNLANLPTIGATAPGNAATSTLHLIVDPTSLNYRALRCVSTRLVDGANSCQMVVTY